MAVNFEKLKNSAFPKETGFHIGKVGHVLLRVSDLERSTAVYTRMHGVKFPEDAIAHPVAGQDTPLPG